MISSTKPEIQIDQDDFLIKLKKIKAWLFDWDGIFNDGHKHFDINNTFSERDSMGTNMLRFAHYLRTGDQPFCAIVTGATNQTARHFAEREHFHAIVPGALYKRDVVEILLKKWDILPEEAAYFYDDILDLNVCEIVGLRAQIRYPSSFVLNQYVDDHELADVITRTSGQQHAIRQLSDFFISLLGQAEEVIYGRMHVTDQYQTYLDSRQKISTSILSRSELLKSN